MRRPSSVLFCAVVAFRCVGAVVALAFINALLPLGTAQLALGLFAVAGIVTASLAANSRLTTLGFCLALGAVAAAPSCSLLFLNWLLSFGGFASLKIEGLAMHLATGGAVGALGALLTWFFWRARRAVTIEALVLLAITIALFSGHRDFHLDRPKPINSLAWRLGIDQLSMLFAVGGAIIAATLAYLCLASIAVRPRADEAAVRSAPARRQLLLSALAVAFVAILVFGIEKLLWGHFNVIRLARISNGVGMSSESGVSPLTFQSALGSSSQPAALVRLEGDYNNNPFSPMMYLRETALSAFNGKEMVFAGRAFDTDLPVIKPRETFTGKEDAELSRRVPLVQSVYLLAEHENAFALDYPVSIVQLKNPKPTRFKGAYRAYSIGPAYDLSEISQDPVGDPRWTPEVRAHFLEQHPDPRYKEFAERSTQGIAGPVQKAQALAQALSQQSIYTLTPRHEVKDGEDPVAPYLFGDMRGYCVHFAHAMVYLLRSLGIPARVGTGYLTDLSQAKDGHILLRMSDRHAWSEVYVSGVGWVPFDVQPEQVESHAETQVDAKMLEELMGILQPGEELLPQELVKDEKGVEEESTLWVPDRNSVVAVFAAIIALFVLTKAALRHGWRLAPTPSGKLRWAYVSVSSALCDLGVTRNEGETRLEFASRVRLVYLEPLARLYVSDAYSRSSALDAQIVSDVVATVGSPLGRLPAWKRCLAAVNPASVAKLIGGGGW